jgi:hypothetical protein
VKGSQTRALVSAGTSLFAVTSAVRDLRKARRDGDRLALLDAAVSLLAVVTGVAIAVRALREGEEDV